MQTASAPPQRQNHPQRQRVPAHASVPSCASSRRHRRHPGGPQAPPSAGLHCPAPLTRCGLLALPLLLQQLPLWRPRAGAHAPALPRRYRQTRLLRVRRCRWRRLCLALLRCHLRSGSALCRALWVRWMGVVCVLGTGRGQVCCSRVRLGGCASGLCRPPLYHLRCGPCACSSSPARVSHWLLGYGCCFQLQWRAMMCVPVATTERPRQRSLAGCT